MNRIALSERLDGLSKIFVDGNQIGEDLRAMSFVLKNTSDEAFSKVLNPEFESDTSVAQAPMEEVVETIEASTEVGNFWSKEAEEVIVSNLLKSILGVDKSQCCDTKRHLTPNQVPDGGHAGEKAKTLKPEQVPNQEYLDSGIVEKSHGSVRKQAVDEEAAETEATKKLEEAKDKAQEVVKDLQEAHTEVPTDHPADAENTEDKATKKVEKAVSDMDKALEMLGVAEKKEEGVEANTVNVSGIDIDLSTSMDEVDINSEEILKLSAMFQ